MTTVDKIEIEKFSKLAKDWWNPNGKFKPLHLFNPVRVKFIKEKLVSYYDSDPNSKNPLKELKILDIGCGGGLLCEPLSRLGATMTGIDASKNNIEVAKLHAKEMNLNIEYIHGAPENSDLKNNTYDAVLCMEIVEHVKDVNLFIEKCSKLIKKNGIMFVATINKTLNSYLKAIIGAEYILRWLPIGTHDWDNFLEPEKLKAIAKNNGFKNRDLIGVKFNPFTGQWNQSLDVSVNYISTFLKI